MARAAQAELCWVSSGCLVLAFTLPLSSVLTMAAVLAVGVAGRFLVLRLRLRKAAA